MKDRVVIGGDISLRIPVSGDAELSNMVDGQGGQQMTVYQNRDYNKLFNKPQINSVELVGNKSLPEIGVESISNMELEEILQ